MMDQESTLREFENAFTYAAIGMALVALDGRWIRVNDAVVSFLGYPREELMRLDFQSLTHPADLSKDLASVEALLAGKVQSYRMEKRYIHSGGEFVWALLSVSLVREIDGTPRYFISQIQDISDLKRIQEELEAARSVAEQQAQAKARFLANMSHEIRTPLNGILGFIDLLRNDSPAPHQLESLDILQDSSNSLLAIISDILDYSKLDAGKLALDLQPCALLPLLKRSVSLFSVQARQKGVSLEFRADPLLPNRFRLDEPRLLQVLNNLIGNAVKFTLAGSVVCEVTGSSAARPNWFNLRIAVTDTGIGISSSQCTRIFNAFEQADSATTRKHGGTGLGLAIATELVSLMGGQLQCESEWGRGSTFWFACDTEFVT